MAQQRHSLPLIVLLLPACATVTTERHQLLSSEVVDGKCTDEITGSVEVGEAPLVHLSVVDHQRCSAIERQTWTVTKYAKMGSTPRLVTAAATTVALLAGFTGLVAATTATHPCCTTADRVHQESTAIVDVAGYAMVLGVGAALWALLGVRTESTAGTEVVEVELEPLEKSSPYSGPLRLGSGGSLQLDRGGAEVDVNELAAGAPYAGQTPVLIEGALRALADAAPRCHELQSLELSAASSDQVRAAASCLHAGWLLKPGWDERCRATFGVACRDASVLP